MTVISCNQASFFSLRETAIPPDTARETTTMRAGTGAVCVGVGLVVRSGEGVGMVVAVVLVAVTVAGGGVGVGVTCVIIESSTLSI